MELKLAAIIGGAIILTAGAFAVADRNGKDGPEVAITNFAAEQEQTEMDNDMSKDMLAEARDKLTPEQYNVCVMGGTEQAFNNKYYDHKEDGTYACIVCGEPLFKSDTKYDSGSGWPAFYDAIDKGMIREVEDRSYGMVRTEVRCGNCDAHLGHLFPDGPQPTGMRYCINSASLDFQGAEGEAAGNEPED